MMLLLRANRAREFRMMADLLSSKLHFQFLLFSTENALFKRIDFFSLSNSIR